MMSTIDKIMVIIVGAFIVTALMVTSSAATQSTFHLLPTGSALPSDEACRAAVASDKVEPRPANSTANNTIPPASFLAGYRSSIANGEGGADARFLQRVDGQFAGSTDAVLKWASCKWGFDEDVTRATAANESHWRQPGVGDVDSGISLGILQIKARDYPSTCPAVAISQSPAKVNDPDCYAYRSTAFNADYKLAQQRACFEGDVHYLTERTPMPGYPTYPNGSPTEMMWGCVGWWYSGGWYDAGAVKYIAEVKAHLADKPWLHAGLDGPD